MQFMNIVLSLSLRKTAICSTTDIVFRRMEQPKDAETGGRLKDCEW